MLLPSLICLVLTIFIVALPQSDHTLRRFLSLILSCFLLPLLLATTSVAQDNNSASKKFTLSGTVVNAATGEPVSRALVSLNGRDHRVVFSDANGTFTFEDIAAGRYVVAPQKPGYFSEQEISHLQQFVEAGPGAEAAVIKLTPESVIFGRLTDANGQPIENIGLRLISVNVRDGRKRWEPRSATQSDEDGSFRFPTLPPGTYYVAAGPDTSHIEGLFSEAEKPSSGWAGTYYPGVPDLASAAPIQVTAGQQIQTDLVMNSVPLYTVSGMVSGYLPDQGVTVQVEDSSGELVPIGSEFSPDIGRFEVRVPAGNYILKALSQAGENGQLRAEARVSVNANLAQLHLALQPAISIPIHVRLNAGAGSGTGAGSRALPISVVGGGIDPNELPPVSVHLIAANPNMSDSYSVVAGGKGNRSLILRSVEPGKYVAQFLPQAPWYVESAQCGPSNLVTDGLTITAGDACSMEISLRNDAGTVSGTVKLPQSSAGGTVLLLPAREQASGVRSTVLYAASETESLQPAFTFDGVAPGEYLLLALDHVEGLEYASYDVLRPYLSQAAHVTVTASQTAKVSLELIHAGADAQ